MEAEYSHTLVIPQLSRHVVNVLAEREQQLLVSSRRLKQVYICTDRDDIINTKQVSQSEVSSLPLPGTLCDAAWTSRGGIVTVTRDAKDNATVTTVESDAQHRDSRETLHSTIAAPWSVSKSHDDGICVADFTSGIYRSLDGGSTWDLGQKATSNAWHCYRAVKVTSSDSWVDYWALEVSYGLSITYRLRIYQLAANSGGKLTDATAVSDVTLPTDVHLDLQSTLVFDGNSHVLLGARAAENDQAVIHVLLVGGQGQGRYVGNLQLTSSAHRLDHSPYSLAVDRSRGLLYVGQWAGQVKVFTLKSHVVDGQ